MAVSEQPFFLSGFTVIEMPELLPKQDWYKLIGTKLKSKEKTKTELKIAFVCNWNDFCGISTYSKYLVDAITPKVKELKIFSEITPHLKEIDGPNVSRCWQRGTSMKPLLDELLAWAPDFIIVQHEYGIFPKATYFLQLLQGIEDIPHVVTMHSVYEHLDKAVCHSAVRNIVVHSEQGKEILKKAGNNSNIFVIPHGCVQFDEKTELWNIFQNPYTLVQFGFGFFYKGVDKVLQAIHHLKKTDEKFKDIFYCYLCSDSVHTSTVHAQYYDYLLKIIEDLDLQENAVIIKKFQTEQTINNYLRTAKIALFPYTSDPKNTVYGASGAIRVAMANEIPVIASDCHQFDDLDGVVPRPHDYLSLAKEIDAIFSNENYRKELITKANNYIVENTWDVCADKYIDLFQSIVV